jgi:hypothetical protein
MSLHFIFGKSYRTGELFAIVGTIVLIAALAIHFWPVTAVCTGTVQVMAAPGEGIDDLIHRGVDRPHTDIRLARAAFEQLNPSVTAPSMIYAGRVYLDPASCNQ